MSDVWHTLSITAAAERLQTDLERGLSRAQAARLQESHGLNQLEEPARRGLAGLLLEQFKDLMILILIAAAIVSGILQEWVDSIAILTIVLLNALIGVVQAYRAERALQALRRLSVTTVRVRRDGESRELDAAELVPGDLVAVETGAQVPADLRLVEVAGLQISEAALTGESNPVIKQTGALEQVDIPLGDRSNMAYRGTFVTYGRAQGLVVATGMDTEIGRIAQLLGEGERPKTPLQQRLARFGQRLAAVVLLICAAVFVAGLLRGEDTILMFLTAVSLAVAAIPEALPAVVTISLALGARKMVRHHALIRHLPAVETLGSVTVICSDKTGTLTQNRMHVEAFLVNERLHPLDASVPAAAVEQLATALALNNDSEKGPEGEIIGEPTEAALLDAVHRLDRDPEALRAAQPRLAEIPFEASRKMMTTLHQRQGDQGVRAYTKGAPERVVQRCSHRMSEDARETVEAAAILEQAEELAADGYRVLAIAYRDWSALPEDLASEVVERDLTFIGLVALMDPPRPEVQEAIQTCMQAGIVPVMVTGDHPATARAIAQRLGMAREGDRLIEGTELAQLSGDALIDAAGRARIYARVSPEQKIRIVEALEARGEFVAMTGDGVNDAPALKRAGIGVAMGQKGTQVAREAADMVLLDDNFATIVAAVREGRRIFDNIRKFIKDTMSSNSGEIWTLFLAPFLGLPVPLLPIHILWINLVTDGLPGLAFTAEPAEPGLMERRPRPPGESIFAHGMWQHILWVGLFVGGVSIASQAWALGRGVEYWQTVVFTVLTISQLFHSLAVRSERASLFQIGLASNPAMLGAVLLTFALQLAVIYVPILNPIFKTQPLPWVDLLVCILLSSLTLVAVEVEKYLVRRGWLYEVDGVGSDAGHRSPP